MSDIVLRADGLAKTFRLGFLRKRVEAVKDATFEVHRGEIFGYLGPNGSGKTTTLKMLMGLVFPSRGRAEVLGRPVPNRDAKRKLGYAAAIGVGLILLYSLLCVELPAGHQEYFTSIRREASLCAGFDPRT